MTDPRPSETSAAELSRELLLRAYPDRPAEWIEQQVTEAVRRITDSVPQRGGRPAVPATSRRRRGLPWLAVLAAIVILVLALREPIAAAVVRETGVVVLAVTVVLAAVTTVWMRVRERRAKVLSCRVRINSRFDFEQVDDGESLELTGPHTMPIEDPGMVLVRVKNLGGTTIEPEDYLSPLRLRFPGRAVRTVDVTQSDPPQLADEVAKHPDFRPEAASITLPKVRLAPDESFNVVVFLSGTKVGERYAVPVEGRLRSGRITPDSTVPWIRGRTIVGLGVTTLAIGALTIVLLLTNVRLFTPIPRGVSCVPGALTVEGSSAFGLAAQATAGEYHAYCADSTIDVRSPGSIEGLNRLRDAKAADRPGRLALVDGKQPDADFPGLDHQSLAVVPYTFVANAKVPVDRLTVAQVRAIFTGRVSRWSEITANPADSAEIRVVGRSVTSGTRRTLERYLLGADQAAPTSESCDNRRQENALARAIVCERSTTTDLLNRVSAVDFAIGYADVPDVRQATGVKPITLDGRDGSLADIRAGYPFWTVEYVYSYGRLENGSLATAFVNYLTSTTGTKTMARFEYFVCDPGMTDLCSSGR